MGRGCSVGILIFYIINFNLFDGIGFEVNLNIFMGVLLNMKPITIIPPSYNAIYYFLFFTFVFSL